MFLRAIRLTHARLGIASFALSLSFGAILIGATSDSQAQTNPAVNNPTTTIISSKVLSWGQLSANQKKILSPLEADWEQLSPDRKQKWTQVATRFEKLPAAEQERLQSRMAEWAKLSPNERRKARDNYLQSLNISSEKKAEAWQAYQQLSAEEKKKLADEANPKKPSLVNSPSLKSK
jgi:membrane protein involved in colicin uptake